jgi:hypothetical protein
MAAIPQVIDFRALMAPGFVQGSQFPAATRPTREASFAVLDGVQRGHCLRGSAQPSRWRRAHNKALQPTPLGVGAGYAGRAPCGAAELSRYVASVASI